MRDACSVRVFVRSRRVVSNARILRFVMYTPTTPLGLASVPVTTVALDHEWRLDPDQEEGLRQARRFAEATGQPLRVVDLGRGNPILRAVRWALRGGRSLPVVVIRGTCAWKTARETSEVARGGRAAAP